VARVVNEIKIGVARVLKYAPSGYSWSLEGCCWMLKMEYHINQIKKKMNCLSKFVAIES